MCLFVLAPLLAGFNVPVCFGPPPRRVQCAWRGGDVTISPDQAIEVIRQRKAFHQIKLGRRSKAVRQSKAARQSKAVEATT